MRFLEFRLHRITEERKIALPRGALWISLSVQSMGAKSLANAVPPCSPANPVGLSQPRALRQFYRDLWDAVLCDSVRPGDAEVNVASLACAFGEAPH